jgi:hypothetical protein
MECRATGSGRQLLALGTRDSPRFVEYLVARCAPFTVGCQYYVVGDRSAGISRATCSDGLVSLSTVVE